MIVYDINITNPTNIHITSNYKGYKHKHFVPTYTYTKSLSNDIKRLNKACIEDGYNPIIYVFTDKVNKLGAVFGFSSENKYIRVYVDNKLIRKVNYVKRSR